MRQSLLLRHYAHYKVARSPVLHAMSLFNGLASKLGSLGVGSAAGSNKISSRVTRNDARVFTQETFRAGLFVTKELDKATSRCREKVESIAEECCDANSKFRSVLISMNGRISLYHDATMPLLET
jgi:hypothetical protein